MKVYDTDEEAIATGARRKMMARVIQVLIMLAFSGLGLWLFYTLVLAPDKSSQVLPSREVTSVLALQGDTSYVNKTLGSLTPNGQDVLALDV